MRTMLLLSRIFASFVVLISVVKTFGEIPPSMLNNTECLKSGFDNITAYQYNFLIKSAFNSTYQEDVFLPIFSSSPLNVVSNASSVLIVVHGLSRNADDFFCHGMTAAGGDPNILVISPWFGDTQILGSDWQGSENSSHAVSAFWSTSNWMSGANNSPQPTKYTSSFSCLDAIVQAVSDRKLFPFVNSIIIAGFSAGGQTVNRYSWATSVGTKLQSDVQIRFIVSDPGSYLYLDGSRPAKDCYPAFNTGQDVKCSDYKIPVENLTDCPGYDSWKYGVGSFPASGYLYFDDFSTTPALVGYQSELMRQKDIRYIFGMEDACNCNLEGFTNDKFCYSSGGKCSPNDYGGAHCCDTYPDSTTDNALSNTCESNIQGTNRLQRGLLYMSYLQLLWAKDAYTPAFETVEAMGHNATAFYMSTPFQQWLHE